jgi:hypothetical protein
MTTAYTSLLGLALPVTGELSGTWGDTVNNSITSLLDSAISGTTTLSSDADITLSTTTGAANESREAILLWTAGGTVTRNITAPAQSKTYIVINKSSSTQSIVLRGVGPTTGVTIIKGESAVCAWNGSDFIKVSNISGAGTFSSITNTGLTSGRVVYSTTGGLETDSANLLFDGTTLTASSITSKAATALTLQSAGTTAVTVDTSQNVGIGTTTTSINDIISAARPLVVAKSDSGTNVGGASASINIVNTDTTTSNGAQLNFASTYTSGGINTASAYISTIFGARTNTSNYYAAGTLVFGTNTGGANNGPGERMRIDSSGNVGIGTTTLNGKLNVLTATDSKLIFNDGSTTGNVRLEAVNNAYSSYKPLETNGSVQIFATGATERMRIDSNGAVLVNTTTRNSSGVVEIKTTIGTDNALVLKTAESGAGGTATMMQTRYNATTVGSITSTSSATAYNTSSDYRLKENIIPMTGALAKVAALKPVTYKWKIDNADGQGFIAHELQEIVPDCVSGEKDAIDEDGNPKYQGIDVSFLVATLTAAIQEQQALITSLTARIATLESK